MMDFDDVCSKPINIDVLKQGLLLDKDCVTFNNKNYYDFWALSIDSYQYSAWHFNKPYRYLKLLRLKKKKKISETKENFIEWICISLCFRQRPLNLRLPHILFLPFGFFGFFWEGLPDFG